MKQNNKKKKRGFIGRRLREASTWRGLVGLLALTGVVLTPDQIELVASIGVAIYMLIETFLPDKPGKKEPDDVSSTDPNPSDIGVTLVQPSKLSRSASHGEPRTEVAPDPRGAFSDS